MKSRVLGVVFLAAIFLAAAPAFAGTVTFNFGQHGDGDLGPGTIAFTAGGLELDVTAWTSDGVQDHVYYKHPILPVDENGLGLASTVDHEINNPSNFLQFDLSKLSSIGSFNLTVGFGSTTNGEKWGLSYSDTNGVLNLATFASGTTETTVTVSTVGFHYLDISSLVAGNTSGTNGGNVLVASASAQSPAPEPTSLLLLGSGLVGMSGMLRKKKK